MTCACGRKYSKRVVLCDMAIHVHGSLWSNDDLMCLSAQWMTATDFSTPGCRNEQKGRSSKFRTIHPGKFTWNTKMEVWKMIFLFNWVMFRFHVNFWRVYSNIFELNQIYTPESLTYPLSKGGWKTSLPLKWSRFWGYGGVPLFFSAHQYPSWNRLPSQISYLSTVATPSINPQNAALFSRMSQSILLEVLSFQQSTHRCS